MNWLFTEDAVLTVDAVLLRFSFFALSFCGLWTIFGLNALRNGGLTQYKGQEQNRLISGLPLSYRVSRQDRKKKSKDLQSHAHGSIDWFNAHTNMAEHLNILFTIEKALDFFVKEGLAFLERYSHHRLARPQGYVIRPGFAMRSRDLVDAWKEYTDILERENIPYSSTFLTDCHS